jgi:hypothetical protein
MTPTPQPWMWRRAARYVVTNVSEEHASSIFMLEKQYSLLPTEAAGSVEPLVPRTMQLGLDCTRAETRLRLLAKRTSPRDSVGATFHSTTGSRSVRVSLQYLYCAGEAMLRGLARHAGHPLHFSVAASFPLLRDAACHVILIVLYQTTQRHIPQHRNPDIFLTITTAVGGSRALTMVGHSKCGIDSLNFKFLSTTILFNAQDDLNCYETSMYIQVRKVNESLYRPKGE